MHDHLFRSRDDRMIAGVAGGLADLWDADPSIVRIVWALLVVLTGGIALIAYIVMAIVVPEEAAAPWPATASTGAPAPGTPAGPDAGAAVGSAFVAGDVAASAAPAASTGGTDAPGAAGGWTTPSGWVAPGGWVAPDDGRAARRAARAARRAERRGRRDSSVPVVLGGLLVILGAFFLIREWLPQIDFDWFWPVVLIVLGVFLVITAVGRGNDGAGSGGSSGGAAGGISGGAA